MPSVRIVVKTAEGDLDLGRVPGPEAAVTAAVHLPVFRNAHLSVSRLKRFEECSFAFYNQYVNRPDGVGREFSEPAEFGVAAHAALERVYQWVLDEEYEGPFPEEQLLEAYRLAWAESGLTGVDLYTEGRELMRQYARWVGLVDHMRVLAVEREFNLLVGPGICRLVDAAEKPYWEQVDDHYVVNGFIDRVDRVDARTVEIVDLKTNRLLFSREELAADLQVAVYAIVAPLLYPWADRVELSFHMLRHGPTRQVTHRSPAALAAVRDYLRAIGARTERGPYPARLNKNCGTCDWREGCETYHAALSKKPTLVNVSREDMEALSEERERVAAIAKAAYARKEQLDAALRDAVGDRESLPLGGFVYKVLQFFNTEYRFADLQPLFQEAGVDLAPALAIDNNALDALLDRVEADETVPPMVRDLLRARCTSRVVRVPQKPRIDSRAVKKR
jgi:putative RecB family exonuclease